MAKQQEEEPLIAKGKVSGDPAAEGLWSAVCVDVHDLGEVESTFKGQTRMVHKVLLGWEIDNLDPKTKMRQVAYRRFTLSVGTKSNLYRFINTWRGKPLTDKEMEGFNVKKLLGAPCQLGAQDPASTLDQCEVAGDRPAGTETPAELRFFRAF